MTTTSGPSGGEAASVDPDTGVRISDRVWRADDGMAARIYQPPIDQHLRAGAVVVDVHGGAWASGDRTAGRAYGLAAAAAGHTVVAVDFRDGRQARHPAAVDDIAEAVAWVRERSGLTDDPDRLALVGASSGGHLALHVALTAVDVAWVGAFWPPVDPLTRYRYAQSKIGQPVPEGNRLNAAGIVASTEAYYGDESTMADASISAIVRSERARHLPPVWLVHAAEDLNVPRPMIDELAATYRSAGGELELTEYAGEIHGFGHGDHAGGRRFRADLVARLDTNLGAGQFGAGGDG